MVRCSGRCTHLAPSITYRGRCNGLCSLSMLTYQSKLQGYVSFHSNRWPALKFHILSEIDNRRAAVNRSVKCREAHEICLKPLCKSACAGLMYFKLRKTGLEKYDYCQLTSTFDFHATTNGLRLNGENYYANTESSNFLSTKMWL